MWWGFLSEEVDDQEWHTTIATEDDVEVMARHVAIRMATVEAGPMITLTPRFQVEGLCDRIAGRIAVETRKAGVPLEVELGADVADHETVIVLHGWRKATSA